MTATRTDTQCHCDLQPPVRNHYFYGKLLDTYHFELETNYLNSKRWLLNRLVSGYGVVCGLDVTLPKSDYCALEIDPGLAIDKHGREIVVPCPQPYEIELPETDLQQEKATPRRTEDDDERHKEKWHLLLCYHECLADPEPIHTSDCDHDEPCKPSAIHERFKIKHKRGHIHPPCSPLQIDDVIKSKIQDVCRRGGESLEIVYKFFREMLVEVVSRPCAKSQENPCIPLANFSVARDLEKGTSRITDVDITIRPIVYNNDLLFQLLMSLMYDPSNYQNTK